VFGNQAWFSREQIISISGNTTQFTRQSDTRRSVAFQFCPTCGSTVYWEAAGFPGLVAIAVRSFADPTFPAPQYSSWERRQHEWGAPLCARAIQQ
jgi:hypothetical protein